jgi:tRNA modification GTPase
MKEDTIVALSSPPGIGAIAAFRLSGPRSFEIASVLTGIKPGEVKERYAYYRLFKKLDGFEIDDGIVIFYPAPKSYTGENMVEFFCHSGPAVLTMMMDAFIDLGARPAEPGEFTRRAFLNGKLDLVQVEAVADIIEAVSPQALEAALNLRKGLFSKVVKELREKLLFLLSEYEAEIDFEEEELLEMSSYKERKQVVWEIKEHLKRLIASARDGIKVREGIRVALAGVPNVGKSSLMNALARRERAIVTPEPGTTRDVIEEKIVLKGMTVVLTDTAGIRKASSLAEVEGVRRAREAIEDADIVLLVLDSSRELSPEEEDLLSEVPLEKTICVLNKIDISKEQSRENLRKKLREWLLKKGIKDLTMVEVSALKGIGISELADLIIKKVFTHGIPAKEELLVTNRRHLYHLQRAEAVLKEAEGAIEEGNVELTAFLLKEAALELSKILGLITHEEIMNEIFSRFCIGK